MPGAKKKPAKKKSSVADDTKKVQDVAPEAQAVRNFFKEAQRTAQCHQRCSDSLPRLLSNHEAAWEEYFSCVSRILVMGKRDPDVERLVQFVTLAAGADVDAALFERTVEFLLGYTGAADKAVRFRCCQLLGSLTTKYTQRPGVSEDDLETFVDVLLPRLCDKVAAVRVQAVGALRPFQFGLEAGDDEEALKEDRVRGELMRAMVSDSSPDVRQAALAAVTKTVGMFDQLVLRTQDVKESVRKAAFRTLGEDVASKHLQPQQRVTLVKRGLSDSSETVVDACRFMVCAHWFRDADYDPVELLQRLDVVGVDKVPEMVVKEIVRLGLRADRERADPSLGMGFTLEDAKALRQAASRRVALSPSPAQGKGTGKGEGGISAEEALYARVQAEVVKEDKAMSAGEKETRLEAILTDTTTLCGQIEANAQELKVLLESGEDDGDVNARVFVLEQLLKLAAHADFSEEAGRRRLVTLLQNLLVDVSLVHQLVEPSMLALAAAHTSEADFVRVVAELVSDISDLLHKHPAGDTSVLNASLNGSLNASFASVMESLGGGGIDGTPNRSFTSMRSAVRAAIPKNFVKDRARAIEGIKPMAGMTEDGGGSGGVDGKKADPVSSEDEFMDALSHHSVTDDDDEEGTGDALRQVAAGEPAAAAGVPPADDGETAADSDDSDVEADLQRLFRILDILSVLLSKTKQTLSRNATLTAFEDVIMDSFKWTAEVLPTACPDFHVFGSELRELAVETLGKYSLLGEAAAVRHCPMLLTIALCEHEAIGVRVYAMQALSDVSLVFRSAVLEATGDVLTMYADVLKDRSANRVMTAVAAEVVCRMLFFELAHNPELLARLIVLYFEKGSAADPAANNFGGGGGSQEGSAEEEQEDEADDGMEKDAKAIGSSVRLSQILGVYFRSLPLASPRARGMLSDSVPHVLRLLRATAKLNAEAEKNNQDEETERAAVIDVPAHDAVRYVMQLLESGSCAAAAAAAAAGESSSPTKEEAEEGENEEEKEEEEGGQGNTPEKPEAEPANNSDSSASAISGTGVNVGVGGVDATGHVALCIAEELWALSGMDGVSDLVASLAKVLASLLPEDDQVTLKRLRKNVRRLETLGDGRLGSKVSRIIAKYAEVLLAADLTPEDSDDDDDEDGDDGDENEDGGESMCAEQGDEESSVQQAPTRKKRTSKSPPPPPPSRRPARRSKVAAQERMAGAEAEAVAAAADEAAGLEESDNDDEEEGDDIDEEDEVEKGDDVEEEHDVEDNGVAEDDAEEDTEEEGGEEDTDDEGNESTATEVSSQV